MLVQLVLTLVLLTATTQSRDKEDSLRNALDKEDSLRNALDKGDSLRNALDKEDSLRNALESLEEAMASAHEGLVGNKYEGLDELKMNALDVPELQEIRLKSPPKGVAEIEAELKAILKSATAVAEDE